MDGERELFEVLDDLEAQAESEHHRDREGELHDRARSEYHGVLLESRLMATLQQPVELWVQGVGSVTGTLARVGDGWCQVRRGHLRWTVLLHGLTSARGLSPRAVPRVAWSRVDTMGVGSPLRRVADEQHRCVAHLADGSTVEGLVDRVGSDFVEFRLPSDETVLVPLRKLTLLRDEPGAL